MDRDLKKLSTVRRLLREAIREMKALPFTTEGKEYFLKQAEESMETALRICTREDPNVKAKT